MIKESMAGVDEKISTEMPKNLYFYWGQGVRNLPPVIKTCLSSRGKGFKGWNLVNIDDKNLARFVQLPRFILEKHTNGAISFQHFSDIIRVALLSEYGGIWADADVYMPHSIGNQMNAIMRGRDYFALLIEDCPASPGNHFIMSRQYGYVTTAMKIGLYMYWSTHDRLLHYFIFHMIHEALYNLDPVFKSHCDAMPYFDAHSMFEYRRLSNEQYSLSGFSDIVQGSLWSKTNHKTDDMLPGTIQEFLCKHPAAGSFFVSDSNGPI